MSNHKLSSYKTAFIMAHETSLIMNCHQQQARGEEAWTPVPFAQAIESASLLSAKCSFVNVTEGNPHWGPQIFPAPWKDSSDQTSSPRPLRATAGIKCQIKCTLNPSTHIGLSHSRVLNLTPPPHVREQDPNLLHMPQLPSCFRTSGVSQLHWPLKQCWEVGKTPFH